MPGDLAQYCQPDKAKLGSRIKQFAVGQNVQFIPQPLPVATLTLPSSASSTAAQTYCFPETQTLVPNEANQQYIGCLKLGDDSLKANQTPEITLQCGL